MDYFLEHLRNRSFMKWLIFCCCGLHSMQGQASTCINIQCDSIDYGKQECEIKEAHYIINATVLHKDSNSNCIYDDGSADVDNKSGRYGFGSNILWVNRGCRALFKVCYTDKTTQSTTKSSSTTQTVTTILTESPTSSEDTDNSHVTGFSTSTDVSSITNNKQRFDTTESQETEEHETPNLPILAVVIPVIVVLLGLTLLGIFLWKQRRSKTTNSEQEHCTSKEMCGNRSSANSNAYSILDETSGQNNPANNPYSALDAPQRTDNNYIVLGPEHSYASIHPEVKSDKRLEHTTQADKTVSSTSVMTGAAEYFILEPNNSYSVVDNGRHYSKEIQTPKDSLKQPCLLSENIQLPEKETKSLVTTQNKESNIDYHNYFKLEAQGLESPLELTVDTNDTKMAYTGKAISNFVTSNSFVLEPSAGYNTIDPKDVVIQTLPDSVYNTTHIKPNEVVQDPNYDTLNSRSQEDVENDTTEYSHTQKRSKQGHDTIDYSHINIVRQNDC